MAVHGPRARKPVLNIVLIITAVAVTLHVMLRRDPDQGLAAAVFFLVLLPNEVQIALPGALPELTGQRVVLLLLLAGALLRDNALVA